MPRKTKIGLLYYGNWGGPNWTGGFQGSWDQLTEEQRRNVRPPIDSQDDCYRTHDIDYGECRNTCGEPVYDFCRTDCESDCFNRGDRRLRECLNDLPDDPAQWPIPPRNEEDYLSAIAHQKLAGAAFAVQPSSRKANSERERNEREHINSEKHLDNPIFVIDIPFFLNNYSVLMKCLKLK